MAYAALHNVHTVDDFQPPPFNNKNVGDGGDEIIKGKLTA